MVNVRFELTTNDPWSADDAIFEALVRWATGKKLLTNPLRTQTKPFNNAEATAPAPVI